MLILLVSNMKNFIKNIAVLSICQGLVMTNGAILITASSLVGYTLATQKALATLPVSTAMIGTLIGTIPASLWMRRIGRRFGFMTGAAFGIIGGMIASSAIWIADFWLFCVGTAFLGIYNAFGQYYRFAAADSANADFKSRAISLVMAGGLMAAFLGPASAGWTKDLLDPLTFLGTYLSIVILAALAILILIPLDIPGLSSNDRSHSGRPLLNIARQPVFLVSVTAAMIGYGVMSLVMTATPLAMVSHGHTFSNAAIVIQWHIVGMFGPSFFTGHLIRRFGVLNVMLAGSIFLCIATASSILGTDFMNYWIGLFSLGLGWNFLFIGGTTLLTECHTEAEKGKVQALNDFFVFGTVALASLGAGTLLHLFGWTILNLGALPFIAFTSMATVWLALHRYHTSTNRDIGQ